MPLNGAFSRPRFLVVAALLFALMAYITVAYGRIALKPPLVPGVVIPQTRRGMIYDRVGRPLAMQVNFYHVALRPRDITDPRHTAEILAPLVGMQTAEVLRRIDASGGSFMYLKKKITEQEFQRINEEVAKAKLTGVQFDRVPGRIYPHNALASSLVGFLGDDGEGLSGIEYALQSTLAPVTSTDPASMRDGSNVYLTIDADLQYQLEVIAQQALEDTGGETIQLVAANSLSGEILSYVSLPAANLNEYGQSTPAERIDRPTTVSYEPGSVFKIFTVAALMDQGLLRDDETFLCDGIYTLNYPNGTTETMHCLGEHGTVTIRRALELSCNDAIFQISERIDSQRFISKLRSFGFGGRTGVELRGETNGILKSPDDPTWSARSKPTIAIGQEIAVSALQVVEASTALTNAGAPVHLTLVSRITDPDGTPTYEHKPSRGSSVIDHPTANHILSYMQTGVEFGIGRLASLGDISIGVKTGTAQMIDPATGTYSATDFLADCVAIFPIDKPVEELKIILYIVLTSPRGNIYAANNIAPVIANAANTIIDHLGLARERAPSFDYFGDPSPPSPVLAPTIDPGFPMPDLRGTPKRLLIPFTYRPDLQILITGDGYVARQTPPPGTIITENQRIELYLE